MGKERDERIFAARAMLAVFAIFLVGEYVFCAAQWHLAQKRIFAQVEANPSRKENLRKLIPGVEGTMFLHFGISSPDVAIAIFDLQGDKRGRRQGCVVLIDGKRIYARRTSPSMLPLAGAPNGHCVLSFGEDDFDVTLKGSYTWGRVPPDFEPDAEVLDLIVAALNVLRKSDCSAPLRILKK